MEPGQSPVLFLPPRRNKTALPQTPLGSSLSSPTYFYATWPLCASCPLGLAMPTLRAVLRVQWYVKHLPGCFLPAPVSGAERVDVSWASSVPDLLVSRLPASPAQRNARVCRPDDTRASRHGSPWVSDRIGLGVEQTWVPVLALPPAGFVI